MVPAGSLHLTFGDAVEHILSPVHPLKYLIRWSNSESYTLSGEGHLDLFGQQSDSAKLQVTPEVDLFKQISEFFCNIRGRAASKRGAHKPFGFGLVTALESERRRASIKNRAGWFSFRAASQRFCRIALKAVRPLEVCVCSFQVAQPPGFVRQIGMPHCVAMEIFHRIHLLSILVSG
jgi:hypothetical protein